MKSSSVNRTPVFFSGDLGLAGRVGGRLDAMSSQMKIELIQTSARNNQHARAVLI